MWKLGHKENNTFDLWYWRRLLRVPWAARRSNQSILKEISPEYALEGLMLKLKLQYFGLLMRRTDSFEKTDTGKDWRQEEKGTTEAEMVGWHYWFNGHESEQALGVGQGRVVCCSSWGCKNLDTTQWLNLTEILGKNRVKKWTETCGIIKKDPTSISSDSQKERKKESQKSIWRKKWLKILILINDT